MYREREGGGETEKKTSAVRTDRHDRTLVCAHGENVQIYYCNTRRRDTVRLKSHAISSRNLHLRVVRVDKPAAPYKEVSYTRVREERLHTALLQSINARQILKARRSERSTGYRLDNITF